MNNARAGRDIIGSQVNHYGDAKGRQGMMPVTRTLIALLVVDVVVYVYGYLSYTGVPGDSGDLARSLVLLLLFFVTCGVLGAWVRRKLFG